MKPDGSDLAASFDWSMHEDRSMNTAACNCGTQFLTHVKITRIPRYGRNGLISKDPCPGCGCHHRIYSVHPGDQTRG